LKRKTNPLQDGASALINLISPAIKTIQKLETVWQTITADLKGLKESAEDPGEDLPDIEIEEVMLEGLIESWNDLGKYGKCHNFSTGALTNLCLQWASTSTRRISASQRCFRSTSGLRNTVLSIRLRIKLSVAVICMM